MSTRLQWRVSNVHRLVAAMVVMIAVAAGLAACAQDQEGTEAAPTTTATTTVDPAATTDPGPTTTAPATTPSTVASSGDTTDPGADGTIEVFFSAGDGSDCGEVRPFGRTVDNGPAGPRAALDQLVQGPTASEQADGASSFFSSATAGTVRSVTLAGGLLLVDFHPIQTLMPNASTSCGSAALRAQLDSTVFQFSAVEQVRYQINGSCDVFHNWLQVECHDVDRSGNMVPVSVADRASGSGCTTAGPDSLPDGRWFGYVDTATGATVSFDLACWFSAQAAVEAATEDGAESPPPNDYHIRNDNPLVRTVTVQPGAEVAWLPEPGDPASVDVVDYTTWVSQRSERPFQPGVWLVVSDGDVTSIIEQYVP